MRILAFSLISILALAPHSSAGRPSRGDPVRVSLDPDGSWIPLGRSALAWGFCLLPQGFLPGSATVASLRSRTGARYPTAVYSTATYPDGSARALRIVAQLPIKLLRGAARLELVAGASPRPSHRLSVTQERGRVSVDTGVLRLTLAGDGPDLIPELRVRGCSLRDPDRPARIHLEVGGVHYSSQYDQARRVGVAGQDALSCRLRVSGRLVRSDGPGGLEYRMGLAFLAGSPLVEIDLHVRALADLGPAEDLQWELPLASGSGARAEILGTGASMSLRGGEVRVEALDGQSVSALGASGRMPLPAGKRNGLLLSGSGSACVALAVSRMRPNAPRAVVARAPGKITLLLHAGPFLLEQGFALRCDLVLGAFARRQTRRLLSALLEEPRPSILGVAERETALVGYSRLSPGWAGRADPAGELLARLLSQTEQGLMAEVGYQDYGDYRYLGGFGNLEYDPAAAFLLAFLEQRDPAWLVQARDQLRHWATHDLSRGERGVPEGFPWMHGPEHRSLTYEAGHVWAGGAVLGWLLLGDQDLGSAVYQLKQAMLEVCADRAEFRAERSYGWSLLALEDLLLLGADSALEASARRLARELIQCQDPRGYFRLDPAPSRSGALWAPTPWVTAGITMEALYRQYLRTRDGELLEAIGRATEFLMRDARGEEGKFAKQVYYGGELAQRVSRAGRANPVDLLLIAAGLGRATLLAARPGVDTLFRETLLKGCTDLKSHRLNAHQAARALVAVRSLANTHAISSR